MSLILALVVIAILIIVWQGFLKGEAPTVSYTVPLTLKQININWSTLQSDQVTELQVFEQIAPFEGEVGRTNPFITY